MVGQTISKLKVSLILPMNELYSLDVTVYETSWLYFTSPVVASDSEYFIVRSFRIGSEESASMVMKAGAESKETIFSPQAPCV